MSGSCNKLQEDFPALSRDIDGRKLIYLDNAATTLKPLAVIDAITHYYATNGANIHRGKHRLSSEASDAYEEARVLVAQHIGAFANEIIFVKNTTEALNLVAQGIGLTAADSIVGCVDAHHSQILPWKRVAMLHLARMGADGQIDLEHLRDLLRTRPKVVALTHCSNVTGVVQPIAEIARQVREVCDAAIVLDAAQSLPHERLNVGEMDVDFVAFSAHKMLGPTGVGCLYGRFEQLSRLAPMAVGGGMVDWVDEREHIARALPQRLEAGTPPIADVIGFGAAIRYLGGLDNRVRLRHAEALSRALIQATLARPYLRVVGPPHARHRHPIVSVQLSGNMPAGEIARLLSDSYGIMCRSGFLCAQPLVQALAGAEVLRFSAYIYNDAAEIDYVYAALDELAQCMGVRC
ncbi:aminotransferase class V-fold PLP-dependent enzyme [Bradyrhizobium sp. CB1015]|uniref:aminotransferase class V-fold PLP-dependent enzyme n=1 Tax=Bradyrhizobium sp. CB1015 TaxID=2976822 RepID=UPI0021AA7CF5|nr:aminotransferase class V-fold PLP-dependent enzyme [Bradyrhizobium sp. CB1015]UWU92931.1 aminotransferase class V-fold PLP-dependent enzyme [Bradyrhizobium sp. CB1015]